MVMTRAQARRERNGGGDASSERSHSSDDNRNGSTNRSAPRRPSAAPPPAAPQPNAPPANETAEKLGRGCRVARPYVSLDEQYLANALYRTQSNRYSLAHTPDWAEREEEEPQPQRRYPIREAAKRALEKLHVTLTNPNGAAGQENDGAAEGEENSNSMGVFHFRNHPELEEEIQKHRAKRRKKLRRGGRRGSDSDSTESDSDDDGSSASSSTSSSSSSSSSLPRRVLHDHYGSTATLAAAAVASPFSVGSSPRNSGTAPRRPTTTDDGARAVSPDSSITDVSLREESVERAAARDARTKATTLLSASSSDDDTYNNNNGGGGGGGGGVDATRDFASEAERRRAQRHARESTNQNVNINFYMADAVGVEDAKRLRRRQRDRRYRWLLGQEEEARARNDGSGIGGSAGEGSAVTTANGALGDILPLRVDDGVTFDSVGGLPEHIVTLREMVLLPLLYPDLFERLDLKAPRGVLFVGPPGTGKTLMARALANEGSRFACGGNSGGGGGASTPSSRHAAASSASSSLPPQRITFFVRKGADMLSKWVGESERQLKLLFEEAKRLQPSIIFFDEVDGLAPTRHAKTEQTQAALVSTLLALLDGLEDRGQVVVIGATNRPDTLDPALRRPGRFDRELIFPLPDAAARRHILTIQLAKKAMPTDVAQRAALLDDLVEMTEGYSGADLGALCTEASLHRLRTALPQLYVSSTRLVVPPALAATQLCVRSEDFYAAAQLMQPSLRRCRSGGGSELTHLDPYVEVLLRGTRDATLAALAPSWSMVDKVLRAGRRDCRDVESAVRALCAVPIPQPPRPCLLVLQESPPSFSLSPSAPAAYSDQRPFHQQQQQQRSLHLHHLSVSLLKGLPGLNQLVVNLPQLDWNSSSASTAAAVQETLVGGEGDYLGGGSSTSDFTHMRQVVLSVQQCSPCVVYLKDADAWLEEGEEEAEDDDSDEEEQGRERNNEGLTSGGRLTRWQQRRVQLFRFYLNMLADVDVMFLLPCASPAVSQALLGSAAEDAHSRGHSSVAKTVAGEGQSQGDLGSQTASLPDTVSAMSQSMVASSDLFSVESALASPSSPMLVADPPSAVQLTRLHTTTTGPRQPSLLHPQFSVVRAVIAATPLPVDLCRFVAYVHRIVTMTLALHRRPDSGGGDVDGAGGDGAMGERLVEDTAPLPSPLANAQLRARRQADRASRRQLWRKVEYRRLQLRHVLMKWVSQYIHSGKFKLLASADLDFAPDNPLFKAWRHHTRHHRLGLQDILEKVEDEKYVCLSQYHDDIDQLVRSVRSFFRTRAAQDQRYRLRALDLKETCLLNMYKLNREVIRFCEETRHAQEPSDSSDSEYGGRSGSGAPSHRHAAVRSAKDRDDDGHTAAAATRLVGKDDDPALIAEQARRAVSFTQRPAAPPAARKRRREWGHRKRRNRRQQPPRPAQTSQKGKEEAEGENKGDGEAGHESKPEKADDDKDGEADVLSGDSSDAEDSDGHSRSSTGSHSSQKAHDEEEEEEETAARGSLDANANSLPVALTDDDGDVEWWACRLLSTFAYTRLYRVFKSVMRGLEVEVRVLDEEASAVVASDAHTEAVPCSRETFADGVFRKLVKAAVEEQ